jgi:hypothetical protein
MEAKSETLTRQLQAKIQLSDDQFAKGGTVLTDAPPMTAEQLMTAGLIDHIDGHFGSIRKTVGR